MQVCTTLQKQVSRSIFMPTAAVVKKMAVYLIAGMDGQTPKTPAFPNRVSRQGYFFAPPKATSLSAPARSTIPAKASAPLP